jgi:hypothetical protein
VKWLEPSLRVGFRRLSGHEKISISATLLSSTSAI